MSAVAMVESTSVVKINEGIDNPAYLTNEIDDIEHENTELKKEISAENVQTETRSNENVEFQGYVEKNEPLAITNRVEQNEAMPISHETKVLRHKIDVVEKTEPDQTCSTHNVNHNKDSVMIFDETRTKPLKYENYPEKTITNEADSLMEQTDNFANEFNEYSKEAIQETITTKNTKRYELERWNKRKSCCFIFFIILFFTWLGCYYVYSIGYFQKKIYGTE